MIMIEDLGLQYANINKTGQKYRYGLYKCSVCGEIVRKQQRFVIIDTCRKCSNKKNATVHGFGKLRIKQIYNKMINRCSNKICSDFKYYGEKGITVCNEWKNDFMSFYNWSMENGYKDDLQIDKDIICEKENISPKIYSPKTCLWITKYENISEKNKRNGNAK